MSAIVLLALFTFLIASVPSAHSQVDTVKVLNYSYYIDMLGNFVIVGEVQNIGTRVLNYTEVAGRVTGSDGTQAEWDNRVLGYYLLPGQKAPFYLQFSSQSTAYGSWYGMDIQNVELVPYKAPETTTYQYQDVIVKTHQGSSNSVGEYWVDGELENIGTQNAGGITIVATYYNSSGAPIALGYSSRISTLSPNEIRAFKVGAFDLNQTEVPSDKKIYGYSLLVQVETPLQEDGNAPTVSSAPVGTSVPDDDLATPLDTSNNNLNTTNIVAIFVVIIVVVAVLLLISKRRNKAVASQKPKQSNKSEKKKYKK